MVLRQGHKMKWQQTQQYGTKLQLHKINGKIQAEMWVLQSLKYRALKFMLKTYDPPPLLQTASLWHGITWSQTFIFNKKPLYSYNYFEGNIISLFLWRCTFSWCLSYILCCCGRKKCHTLLQCFWETLSSTYLDQSWWLGSSIVTNFNTYCE